MNEEDKRQKRQTRMSAPPEQKANARNNGVSMKYNPKMIVMNGVVSAGAGAVQPGEDEHVGAGGALYDCDVRHVADGDQHGGGRAGDPAGLPERREGAEAVADEAAVQDSGAGGAAVHVHGLPVV